MSTLRVDTIQNAAGTDSPINVPGTAKAWVNFNGTGTVAIRASYNVSSITDIAAGVYAVNFTTALVDANYSAVSMSADASAGTICFIAQGSALPTASGLTIRTAGNASTIDYDTPYVCVAIFR
jgi:hypothetical protein